MNQKLDMIFGNKFKLENEFKKRFCPAGITAKDLELAFKGFMPDFISVIKQRWPMKLSQAIFYKVDKWYK